MAEDAVHDRKAFDPMDPWRGVRDVYMDAWAKTMVETVNSEAYAQATGTILDTYLTVSAPFREALEKAMIKTLERLADMDAKLDAIHALIARAGVAPPRKPGQGPQPTNKKAAKSKKAKRGEK